MSADHKKQRFIFGDARRIYMQAMPWFRKNGQYAEAIYSIEMFGLSIFNRKGTRLED